MNSPPGQEYLGFIIAIGEAIKGKKLTDEVGMKTMYDRDSKTKLKDS